MGQYINSTPHGALPAQNKAAHLLATVPGTLQVPAPTRESDFVDNLVCVVENGIFDAAGYCFSAREMMAFAYPDSRRKTWLVVPDASKFAR
jgi:hypothetical protein